MNIKSLEFILKNYKTDYNILKKREISIVDIHNYNFMFGGQWLNDCLHCNSGVIAVLSGNGYKFHQDNI